MFGGEIHTSNKEISIEEKNSISNILKDQKAVEEERLFNLTEEKEKETYTKINEKINEIKPKNEQTMISKVQRGLKNNPKDILNFNEKFKSNMNNNFGLKETSPMNRNVQTEKKRNFNNNFNHPSINTNNQNVNIVDFKKPGYTNEYEKNKKLKISRRVKFKEKFLDIVPIESFKTFNANMCFSDLEFVETGERKSLCRELCNII